MTKHEAAAAEEFCFVSVSEDMALCVCVEARAMETGTSLLAFVCKVWIGS